MSRFGKFKDSLRNVSKVTQTITASKASQMHTFQKPVSAPSKSRKNISSDDAIKDKIDMNSKRFLPGTPGFYFRKMKHIHSRNGKKAKVKKVLELIGEITEKSSINMGITTLSNLIMVDADDLSSEIYKDHLQRLGLDTRYYEIKRCLHHGCYEQASLLALSSYEDLSQKIPNFDQFKAASQLQLFEILTQSSNRNDAIICLKVVNILSESQVLNDEIYANLLANAIKFQNAGIISAIFPIISNKFQLEDTTWKNIAEILIDNDMKSKIPQVIVNTKSQRYREEICLMYLGSLDVRETFLCLESLILDEIIECPRAAVLPSSFRNIPDLKIFKQVVEYKEIFESLKLNSVKKIFLYSILSSINDQNLWFQTTLFLLNELKSYHNLIDEIHTAVIFNQLSKYSFKITSIKLLFYFKEKGISISLETYMSLMKIQCHGQEFDTLYIVLIEALSEHGKLSTEMQEFLNKLYAQTEDGRIKYFLKDDLNILDLKEAVDHKFIYESLEQEREREKSNQNILENFQDYSYEADIHLVHEMQFI